jgi:phospholipase/lecithinase/hemolysin
MPLRAAAFAALILFGGATAAGPFQALVIVGDSLSETGNAFAASAGAFPVSPPNAAGRFSNGPVWVEVLAGQLGLPAPTPSLTGGSNFAFGGATTDSRVISGIGDIGMASQVQQIGLSSDVTSILGDALTVVWGGPNDLFLSEGTGYDADPQDSVNNLVARISTLIGLGAEAFLLPNLPPLGQTPKFLGGSDETTADAFATGFDTAYRAEVATLAAANPDRDFYYFDVFSIIEDVLADPVAYGFANVTDPALVGLTPVANPNEYLYWDDVHPTQSAHAQLGVMAAALVPVPVPPVLLLFMAGFSILLVMSRRAGVGDLDAPLGMRNAALRDKPTSP